MGRYAEHFWSNASAALGAVEYERVLKVPKFEEISAAAAAAESFNLLHRFQFSLLRCRLPPFPIFSQAVEKGERKLGEIERLTECTAKFLALWSDPLSELRFRFVGTHGHVFGVSEDRHLLVYTNTHG